MQTDESEGRVLRRRPRAVLPLTYLTRLSLLQTPSKTPTFVMRGAYDGIGTRHKIALDLQRRSAATQNI